MNIWIKKSESFDTNIEITRSGLQCRFDKNIDKDLRKAIIDFTRWLRINYSFPYRVIVYIKSSKLICASNGEMVYDTCFRPFSKKDSPHIRISVGDYQDLKSEMGRDDAIASILGGLIAMITHYYQWVLDMNELSEADEEKQAKSHIRLILNLYAKTRKHP